MSIKLKNTSELLMSSECEAGGLEEVKPGFPVKKKRAPAALTILCPVCSGPAPDHIHFGGQCCYSCRAFFRRTSVKTPASYRCRSGKNDCIISSGVKSCISCRLQKCLKIGMDPKLVRGKKYKRASDDNNIKNESFESMDTDEEREDKDLMNYHVSAIQHTTEQERILKSRAELLKYQGLMLHYQASLLEEEAQRRTGYTSTIYSSQTVTNEEDYYTSPPPAYQRSYDYLDQLRDRSPCYEDDSTSKQCEDQDDAPLDLSVKKDVSSGALHHTQSVHMPRIFFSMGNKC